MHLGIVGVGGRGSSFSEACRALGVRIHAVCDTDPQRLSEAKTLFYASESYTDFAEMLERSQLDAVLIGTPMQLHAPQSIMALQHGVHVLCEVTPAVTVDECEQLVRACARSRAVYVLAENCNLMRPNVVIAEMVRRGAFGQTYYAEGGYLHELRDLNERTPWRRRWQTGVNGITYGTHSLGPILQWMPGDRVVEVCCAGSGHHYRDARGGAYENEDSCVMLCKLRSGGLVKMRVDMLSNRPYGLNYALQGTEGAYESARAPGETGRVWLWERTLRDGGWTRLADLEGEFLPDWFRERAAQAGRTGHDGSDYFVIYNFLEAIAGRAKVVLGVHEAMDMALPCLVSQQSIAQHSVWLNVPDSRDW
jgi:predicted dehydrogenase